MFSNLQMGLTKGDNLSVYGKVMLEFITLDLSLHLLSLKVLGPLKAAFITPLFYKFLILVPYPYPLLPM